MNDGEKSGMCEHDITIVRFKVDSLGRSLYANRCVDCGDRVGDWISHKSPLAKGAPPWDEELTEEPTLFEDEQP